MSQFWQQQALHPALMDDREQLVLDVRTAATDLVENHRACAPDRGRCLDVLERAVECRHREPHQVVKVQKAGVVVPKRDLQRLGSSGQQQAFGGAVWADQQQRRLGCQRCQICLP